MSSAPISPFAAQWLLAGLAAFGTLLVLWPRAWENRSGKKWVPFVLAIALLASFGFWVFVNDPTTAFKLAHDDYLPFLWPIAIFWVLLALAWRFLWRHAVWKEWKRNKREPRLTATTIDLPDESTRSSATMPWCSMPTDKDGRLDRARDTASRSTDFRFATYALSAFLLLLLFWALPMELDPKMAEIAGAPLWTQPAEASIAAGDASEELKREALLAGARMLAQKPPQKAPAALAEALLWAEHGKAIEEIKMRIEQGDNWFHRKFIMIGGLVVAFLTALGSDLFKTSTGTREQHAEESAGHSRPSELDRRFGDIMRSNAACSLLALATAVAVGIDIQTKTSDTVVQQIALWIKHYVEPAFVGYPDAHVKISEQNRADLRLLAEKVAQPPRAIQNQLDQAGQPAAGENPEGEPKPSPPAMSPEDIRINGGGGLVPYERFLRLEGKGMHTDPISKLLFHPHGYFLTWAIYLLYLTSFHKICFRASNLAPARLPITQQRIAVAAFALVHFCLAAFAVITHSAPSAFWLSLGGIPVRGDWSGLIFLIPWAMLVAIHRPYWKVLVTGSRRNERDLRCKVMFDPIYSDGWICFTMTRVPPAGRELEAMAEDEKEFVLIEFKSRDAEKAPTTPTIERKKLEAWTFLGIAADNHLAVSVERFDETPKGYIFRAATITSDGEIGSWTVKEPESLAEYEKRQAPA